MKKYEPLFAKYYDYVAHDRREALATDEDLAFIKHAFEVNCARPVRDILDVGCGTGRYLVPLAASGFKVTGIDTSPDMLAHCRTRLAQRDLEAALVELDLMEMAESSVYDALLCMDSTLCYLTETGDIVKALSLFEHALRPGGLLVLEVFNASADAGSLSTAHTWEVRDGPLQITTKEYDWYEALRSVLHKTFDVIVTDGGREHVFSHEEELRVMSAAQVASYLEDAGFMKTSYELRKDSLTPESGDENLVFLALKQREKGGSR